MIELTIFFSSIKSLGTKYCINQGSIKIIEETYTVPKDAARSRERRRVSSSLFPASDLSLMPLFRETNRILVGKGNWKI